MLVVEAVEDLVEDLEEDILSGGKEWKEEADKQAARGQNVLEVQDGFQFFPALPVRRPSAAPPA